MYTDNCLKTEQKKKNESLNLSPKKINIKFFFRQVLKSVKVGFSLRTGSSEFQSLAVLKQKILCPVAVFILNNYSSSPNGL